MSHSKEIMVKMYTTMNKIRMFESMLQEYFAAGKIPGFVHLYLGEEAVALAFAGFGVLVIAVA